MNKFWCWLLGHDFFQLDSPGLSAAISSARISNMDLSHTTLVCEKCGKSMKVSL